MQPQVWLPKHNLSAIKLHSSLCSNLCTKILSRCLNSHSFNNLCSSLCSSNPCNSQFSSNLCNSRFSSLRCSKLRDKSNQLKSMTQIKSTKQPFKAVIVLLMGFSRLELSKFRIQTFRLPLMTQLLVRLKPVPSILRKQILFNLPLLLLRLINLYKRDPRAKLK